MPLSLLPFMLLLIPIVEIGVFIAIGDRIGIFYTLMMILVTAIIGSILLRIEGFRILKQIQNEMGAGKVPAKELTNGVMILIAGVLLLTPGFVTDTLGFLLFLPPVRAAIRLFLVSRIKFNTQSGAAGFNAGFGGFQSDPNNRNRQDQDGPIVDLDEKAWTRDPDPSSPWNSETIENQIKKDEK